MKTARAKGWRFNGGMPAPTAAIPMRADINGAAGSLAAVPQTGIADFHHSRSL